MCISRATEYVIVGLWCLSGHTIFAVSYLSVQVRKTRRTDISRHGFGYTHGKTRCIMRTDIAVVPAIIGTTAAFTRAADGMTTFDRRRTFRSVRDTAETRLCWTYRATWKRCRPTRPGVRNKKKTNSIE